MEKASQLLYTIYMKVKMYFNHRQNLFELQKKLNDIRSSFQKKEMENNEYLKIKITCSILIVTTFVFQIALFKWYVNYRILYLYWTMWVIMLVLMIYCHFRDKPKILQLILHLMILRLAIPLIDFDNRQSIEHFDDLFIYVSSQISALLLLLIMLSLSHPWHIHVPFSIIY